MSSDFSPSPDSRPEAVVFDLSGVVLRKNPRFLAEKLFEDSPSIETFLSILRSYKIDAKFATGEKFEICAADVLKEHPEQEAALRAYFDRYDEVIGDQNDEVVKIIEDLRKQGLPSYAMVNWHQDLFPRLENRFADLKNFKGIFVSGQEKLLKSSPDFYRHLVNKFDLRPERTVLVDNKPENIETMEQAKAFPVLPLLFEHALKLRYDLTRMNALQNG